MFNSGSTVRNLHVQGDGRRLDYCPKPGMLRDRQGRRLSNGLYLPSTAVLHQHVTLVHRRSRVSEVVLEVFDLIHTLAVLPSS